MATVWTLTEESIRKLGLLVDTQQAEISNLRRKLAHYSTRRHEAVYLPGSKIKLVSTKNVLQAAFGGGHTDVSYKPNLDYANAEVNSLCISTGNYVAISSGDSATARNRILYPAACYVWERNASGVLVNTFEEIDCVNLGSLPIMQGCWCLVQKFGDDWVVIDRLSDHAREAKHFEIDPETDSQTVTGSSAKLIRGSAFQKPEESSTPTYEWAHHDNGHVFIHHPGTYTITFGAEIRRSSSDSADDTTWTDSDGDTLDLPNPMAVEVGLVKNWNPSGDIVADWDTWVGGSRAIKYFVPARGSYPITSERTITVNHTMDTWHGQPYLRLNLGMKVTQSFGGSNSIARFVKGWIHIRAEGGAAFGGNEGTGYNAFLGTDGAFQWWGGGSEPIDFDENGDEV